MIAFPSSWLIIRAYDVCQILRVTIRWVWWWWRWASLLFNWRVICWDSRLLVLQCEIRYRHIGLRFPSIVKCYKETLRPIFQFWRLETQTHKRTWLASSLYLSLSIFILPKHSASMLYLILLLSYYWRCFFTSVTIFCEFDILFVNFCFSCFLWIRLTSKKLSFCRLIIPL